MYVFGFPLGERPRQQERQAISNTGVSSLHRGNDGIVTKVQVNGGMDPGNSGGPVVDARGNALHRRRVQRL